MEMLQENLWWLVPAVVVALAIAIGVSDVARFSLSRAWAISSVCFQESLRRRVLWVVPLAIVGVLAVSAFQQPIDVQDAIRQQLKFCLFAAGMLVVLTVLILACTNLPREIDSRVIYTIVTKPTSRLEIVLGKVIGFARVSGLVLGIMAVFTWAYLGVSSARYQNAVSERLAAANVPLWERSSLENYQKFGLLSAKRLEGPVGSHVYSSLPAGKPDEIRWTTSVLDGELVVPFIADPTLMAAVAAADDKDPNQPRLAVVIEVHSRDLKGTIESPPPTPLLGGQGILVNMSLFNQWSEMLVDPAQLGAQNVELAPVQGSGEGEQKRYRGVIPIARQFVPAIAGQGRFYVQVTPATPSRALGIGPRVMEVVLIDGRGNQLQTPDGKPAQLDSISDRVDPSRQLAVFRGRQGRGGQQVRGEASGDGTVALYQFRGARFPADLTGVVGGELRVALERNPLDDELDKDIPTHLEFTFYNRSNAASAPIKVSSYPENNRTAFINVPAEAVAGGDFDVAVRCLSNGHWFTASGSSSLVMVSSRQPFAWNLLLSMFVLWMMSLLVVTVSVFCSTFLSWPIAVVLTLVILLARWGVVQLGDSLQSGIGNQVATQVFGSAQQDPAAVMVVSRSVEALSAMLRTMAEVLPDISRFAAVQEIERGLQVSPVVLAQSGMVLLMFGLPLLAMAYVFFRYKEVAP